MSEHLCQCWHCKPESYPAQPEEPTIAYAAVGVDGQRPIPGWVRAQRRPMSNTRVFLDGVECDKNGPMIVFEAMAGNPGWVVGFERLKRPVDTYLAGALDIHYCRICLHNRDVPMTECSQVRRGEVTLEFANGR